MNTIETALINKVQQLIIQNEQAVELLYNPDYSGSFKDFLLSDIYEEASRLYITLEKYLKILDYLDQSGATYGIITKSIIQVHEVHYTTERMREELYR